MTIKSARRPRSRSLRSRRGAFAAACAESALTPRAPPLGQPIPVSSRMVTVRVCPAQMVAVLAGLLERKLRWGRERISQVPGRTVRRWRSCTPPRPGRRRRRTARPPSRLGMSPAGRVRRLIVRWDELTEVFLGDQPDVRARAGRAWQDMWNEHADQLRRSSRAALPEIWDYVQRVRNAS